MRVSSIFGMGFLLVQFALLGCGSAGAPEATTPTSVEPPAPPSPVNPPPDAEAAAPSDEAKPAAATPSQAGSALTEEKLRAAKSLEASFPEVDAVAKEVGAPAAKGKGPRKGWWFNKRPLGKTFSCDTIDLIRGPSGRVVVDVSVMTSDDCKKVPTTKAQVVEVLATLAGEPAPKGTDAHLEQMAESVQTKKFEEASALFEKKLGKPHEAAEPDFASWRYNDDAGECHALLLTSHLGSNAAQAIWGLPCD